MSNVHNSTSDKLRPSRPLWSENADIALRTRRMTQTELSKRIGLSRPTVNLAINTGKCSDATKKLICDYLGI